MKQILALLLLLPSLVACASLDTLKRIEPSGSPFAQAAAKHYKEFAQSEAEQYDWVDSQYFAEKGLEAAYGNPLHPELLEHWNIPQQFLPTMQDARKQLMEALTPQALAENPVVAARALFNFDCWVEQQEENWQGPDIAACRDEFYGALNVLTAKEPVVLQEINPLKPVENKAEQISTSYVIFFGLNSTSITKDGDGVIDDVYNELSDDANYVIRLDGFADRSGKDSYNKVLSLKRAEAVKNKLLKRGLNKGNIEIEAHGEERPLIETPDGVKEKANRRVEIFINE